MTDIRFLKRYVDSQGSIHKDILDVDDDLTNLCWLPVLDTTIEPDNWELFWTLWNQNKTFMSPTGRETAVWESLCIWKSSDIEEDKLTHVLYPQKMVDWSTHFPKMFEQIFSVMPYSEIWKVTLGENINRVPAHVDRPASNHYEVLSPWPNSVRILLHDTNTQPTFYLTPWPQELMKLGKIQNTSSLAEWGTMTDPLPHNKCYVQLPEKTNTFVFSNGEFLHGADFSGKSKILILIWGRPDATLWKKKLKKIKNEFSQSMQACRFKLP